jgi:hypothetical protein
MLARMHTRPCTPTPAQVRINPSNKFPHTHVVPDIMKEWRQ